MTSRLTEGIDVNGNNNITYSIAHSDNSTITTDASTITTDASLDTAGLDTSMNLVNLDVTNLQNVNPRS